MKKKFTILVCMLCLLNVSSLLAQFGGKPGSCVPVKTGNSALYYGNDVLVNDQPAQDQRNASITVDYTGALYSAYTYSTSSTNGVVVMKSTNSGLTWSVLLAGDVGASSEIISMDIVAAGTTPSDLKLFGQVSDTILEPIMLPGLTGIIQQQVPLRMKSLMNPILILLWI